MVHDNSLSTVRTMETLGAWRTKYDVFGISTIRYGY